MLPVIFNPFFVQTIAAVLEFLEPSSCLVCWRALKPKKYNDAATVLRELRLRRLCRACHPERLASTNRCILCQEICRVVGETVIDETDENLATTCQICKTYPLPFARIRSYALYQGRLRPLIHAMKYHRNARLARHVGELMGEAISDLFPGNVPGAMRWDLVIPVPPSAVNLKKRGFNQAAVMARGLRLGPPIREIFHPIDTNSPPRALTSPLARRPSLQINLYSQEVRSLTGKRVLLVDDVLTTGGTATKAAQMLLQSGVCTVDLYTFARSTLWLEYRSASLARNARSSGDLSIRSSKGGKLNLSGSPSATE